jgi:hypothetical protein
VDFTVPGLMPSTWAISASDSPTQYRRTSTSPAPEWRRGQRGQYLHAFLRADHLLLGEACVACPDSWPNVPA